MSLNRFHSKPWFSIYIQGHIYIHNFLRVCDTFFHKLFINQFKIVLYIQAHTQVFGKESKNRKYIMFRRFLHIHVREFRSIGSGRQCGVENSPGQESFNSPSVSIMVSARVFCECNRLCSVCWEKSGPSPPLLTPPSLLRNQLSLPL